MANRTILIEGGEIPVVGLTGDEIPGICLTSLSATEVGTDNEKFCRGKRQGMTTTGIAMEVSGEANVLATFTPLRKGEFINYAHPTLDATYLHIFADTDADPVANIADAYYITEWTLNESGEEDLDNSTYSFTMRRDPEFQPPAP